MNPRRIERIPGPEDIVIDHDLGRAYVSSQIRHGGSSRQMNGGIYELDLTEAEPVPRCLTGALESELGIFHPHGIDLFIDREAPGEPRYLFAINHRTSQHHTIEIFQINTQASLDGRLKHLGSVTDDTFFTSPNDLIAVAADEFYLVNDHGWRHRVYQGLETAVMVLTGLGMGSLVHVKLADGSPRCTRIADDIALPVGIEANLQTNPQRLFVSSAWGKQIRVYERTDTTSLEDWHHAGDIPLSAAPDNLTWEDPRTKSELLVAAHPDMLTLMLYAAELRRNSPSRVLCVRDPAQATQRIDKLYEDDGAEISASSVAAVFTSTAAKAGKAPAMMLIGSPWGEHVLACDR